MAYFRDIGRPLDPVWGAEFQAAFQDVTDGLDVQLNMCVAPGIPYVFGSRIERAYEQGALPKGSTDTKRVVDALLEESVFDNDSATQGLEVELRRIEVLPARGRLTEEQLRLSVGDNAYSGYPQGYAIVGEKQAAVDGIGTERQKRRCILPTSGEDPRHRITIGTLAEGSERIDSDVFIALRSIMSRHTLSLRQVGEVNDWVIPILR